MTFRASCKTHRRVKSPFWRPLSRRRRLRPHWFALLTCFALRRSIGPSRVFAVYFLKYIFAAIGRTCLQVLARSRQNLRFSAGVEFCNWLFALLIACSITSAPLLSAGLEIPTDFSQTNKPATIKVLIEKQKDKVLLEAKGRHFIYHPSNEHLISQESSST